MSLTTARRPSAVAEPGLRRAPGGGWADRHARTVFLAPAILYLLAITVFPFVYSVVLSTTNRNLARPGEASFVGLGNYSQLASDPVFHKALTNTAVVTVTSITIEVVIGFAIAKAFFLIRESRGTRTIRTVFILPMMITPVVSGLLWTYILNPTLGITNYLLDLLHLPPFAAFAESQTALLSVILVNSWQWTPFLMLLAFAGLAGIPRDLYEAAAVDGAGLWATIRYIELPAIRNVLLIGIMFRVLDNFRLFDVVYATTRGGPGAATEVASMFAFRHMFQFFNVGYGSAIAVVIFVLALLLANVLFWVMRKVEG